MLVGAGNVIRTAFDGNAASQKGGALFSTSSTGNIMNSTFTSNKAVQSGGGVFQNDCASSISFSIFSKNDGGSLGGGGVLPAPCPEVLLPSIECTSYMFS
jgi:predicted outer membrane repeat protein